jgi:hypothetical protein
MTTAFHTILQELGENLDLDLIPDTRSSCTLLYQNRLSLQLETDAYEKYLLAICRICELPPGRFRENVLQHALQFNDLYPLVATLGYSSKYNALVLSCSLLLEELKGRDLLRWISQWFRIADLWKKAIDAGQSVPSEFYPRKT